MSRPKLLLVGFLTLCSLVFSADTWASSHTRPSTLDPANRRDRKTSTATPQAPDSTAPSPNQTKDSPDNPIQVHGQTVEYFHDQKKVVGTGHVVIDYQGAKLSADKITVYMDSKIAVAEGHVELTEEGSIFRGERAEYNFDKKIGNVSQMDAEIKPSYFGKAQKIERTAPDHYTASNAYVTTCCGDSPFYKIQAQHIDIYPEKKIVVRNALLFVKGIPIFFIPYYSQSFFDMERFPVQLLPGKDKKWGAFMLSKTRYTLADEPSFQDKGNILLDYRQERGFGGGLENYYRGEKIGHGAAKVYYADDRDPEDDVDSDRYRAQWRHQSKLGEFTTLTTEFNKLSDGKVIKDFFFREEYEKDVIPDNYISIITAKPDYTLSFLERERLNRFSTVVERSPEIGFDTQNKQFVDTPFYLREEVRFSNLKQQGANSGDGMEVIRLDTNHTASYAGHVANFSVTPRVSTRQTFYSRDLDEDSALIRGTFEPGLDISTHFFKVYDFSLQRFGLDYNKLRHVFTPTVSYNYRPNPTVSRTTLEQFDSVDAIDKQNFIRYNFENKLQTKEHHGTDLVSREIARLIPFLDTDLHTGRLENVGIDVELKPYSWLGFESDATYNSRTRDIDTANFDVYLNRDDVTVGVGQRYLQDESSQTTAQIKWKINADLEVKLYERYEFQTSQNKEFEITLSKGFSCTIVDFIYNNRDGGNSFLFMFKLKAFPTASFGANQSYNSPKAPASVHAESAKI